MLVLAATLAVLAGPATPAGPPDLWALAGLVPGEHAVGYRSLRLRDASRKWASSEDPSGHLGRPVQISVWYPAVTTSGSPLSIADYVVADATGATPGGSPGPDAASPAEALARARRAFDQGLDTPLTDAQWDRASSALGRARASAVPLPSRSPLVLFEPGLAARSYVFVPLVEWLASHGYVVASLASEGKSETERLGFDTGGVAAQVGDLRLALEALLAEAGVDAARVGLVGWSVGGVSLARVEMERPGGFRAAVSLDSGTGYAYGADMLRDAGAMDPERLSIPFLQLDAGRADVPVPRDDAFYAAHGRAAALRLELVDMRHGDLVLPSGLGRAAALGSPAPAGTAAVAEYVRLFLDAYLSGDARARERLEAAPSSLRLSGVRVKDRRPGEGVETRTVPATVEFTSETVALDSDGWRIVGDLMVPEPPGATGAFPAVVMLNKAAGNRSAYAGLARQLACRGIASLRIDLRAHGDSTNRGRFIPPEGLPLLEGSERDVAAAVARLSSDPRVDPGRIALVGASYSGEAMMKAARAAGFAAAYVALSPGSLSDESIAAIDREKLPFLMVVSRHERYLREVAQALRDQSRTAEFLELAGTEHASDLLASHPGLDARIALWLAQVLDAPGASACRARPVR